MALLGDKIDAEMERRAPLTDTQAAVEIGCSQPHFSAMRKGRAFPVSFREPLARWLRIGVADLEMMIAIDEWDNEISRIANTVKTPQEESVALDLRRRFRALSAQFAAQVDARTAPPDPPEPRSRPRKPRPQ